jgi:hypothetical protein
MSVRQTKAATTPNNDRSRIGVGRSTQNANKTIIAWPKHLAGYETLRKKLRKLKLDCDDFHGWLLSNIVPLRLPTSGEILFCLGDVIFITQSFISDSFNEKQTDITKLEVDMLFAEKRALSELSIASQDAVGSTNKLLIDCSQKISLIINNLRELLRELKTDAAYKQLRKRHSNLRIS